MINDETIQKQLSFEDKLFDIGLEAFERKHKRATSKGYGTSSPKVLPVQYQRIENFAHQIKVSLEDRQVLNKRTGEISYRNVENKVLAKVVELYIKLDEDQPDLAFHRIAATAWKSLVDFATATDYTRMNRAKLKTRIGELLHLQYRALHWKKVADFLLKSDDDADLERAKHLCKLYKSLTDNTATLAQRKQRMVGLFNEVEFSSEDKPFLVKSRGRQSGVKMYFPPESRPEQWDDYFREVIGLALLNLLCVGKNDDLNDPVHKNKLFYYEAGKSKNEGDIVRPLESWKDELKEITEKLEPYLFAPLPMLAPPANWEHTDNGQNNATGGYYQQSLRRLNQLVRASYGKCDTTPSEGMLDLLNKVQGVEWSFDKDQRDMVLRLFSEWDEDYDGVFRPLTYTVADLKDGIKPEVRVIPEVQYRIEHLEEHLRIQAKISSDKEHHTNTVTDAEWQTYDDFKKNNFKLRLKYDAIQRHIQRHLGNIEMFNRMQMPELNETFYFPHNFDYRTRLYPIPSRNNPQGAPPERYSLQFANGEHLTPEGEQAALRSIGAAWNDTKDSIDSRIKWSRENLDLVRFLGEGTNASLAKAKEATDPLMMIQLCRAWSKHEQGQQWHVPCYADASNSGWQITSALINSVDGLHGTNVVASDPSQLPQDAYSSTQRQVVEWLSNPDHDTGIDDPHERELLIQVLTEADGKLSRLGRKLSKSFGRTAIYGSRTKTQSSDIRDELEKANITEEEIGKELRNKLVSLIHKAYTSQLGKVLQYNGGFRKMFEEFIYQQVDPDVVTAWRQAKTQT